MSLPVFILSLGVGAFLTHKILSATASRNPPQRRRLPAWRRTERDVCQALGLPHQGGPGKADCGQTVEVKDWARPVDAGTVAREYEKGRRAIVSVSGFTVPAYAEAERLGVRLYLAS